MCWGSRPPSARKEAAGRSHGSRGGGSALEGCDVAFLELAGGQVEGGGAPARRTANFRGPTVLAIAAAFDHQMAVVEAVGGHVVARRQQGRLIFVLVGGRRVEGEVVASDGRAMSVTEGEIARIEN